MKRYTFVGQIVFSWILMVSVGVYVAHARIQQQQQQATSSR